MALLHMLLPTSSTISQQISLRHCFKALIHHGSRYLPHHTLTACCWSWNPGFPPTPPIPPDPPPDLGPLHHLTTRFSPISLLVTSESSSHKDQNTSLFTPSLPIVSLVHHRLSFNHLHYTKIPTTVVLPDFQTLRPPATSSRNGNCRFPDLVLDVFKNFFEMLFWVFNGTSSWHLSSICTNVDHHQPQAPSVNASVSTTPARTCRHDRRFGFTSSAMDFTFGSRPHSGPPTSSKLTAICAKPNRAKDASLCPNIIFHDHIIFTLDFPHHS